MEVNKFWKISNLIILGILAIICFLGTFYKHISFGWGLGDLFGYAIMYSTLLIHLILTFIGRKKGRIWHIISTLIFLPILISICLYATIWRGSEYSWNGSLFYLPCPHKIKIKEHRKETIKLVRMCTMEYHSAFSAKWDGEYMNFEKGELKIPNELKKHIDFPIKKITIKSSYSNRIKNGVEKKEYRFLIDTLKENRTYELTGEIIKITDRKPIFKVRIE